MQALFFALKRNMWNAIPNIGVIYGLKFQILA